MMYNSETHYDDQQVTQTVVNLSPDSRGVDVKALPDTSEVMFDPFLGELMARQLVTL